MAWADRCAAALTRSIDRFGKSVQFGSTLADSIAIRAIKEQLSWQEESVVGLQTRQIVSWIITDQTLVILKENFGDLKGKSLWEGSTRYELGSILPTDVFSSVCGARLNTTLTEEGRD